MTDVFPLLIYQVSKVIIIAKSTWLRRLGGGGGGSDGEKGRERDVKQDVDFSLLVTNLIIESSWYDHLCFVCSLQRLE